MLLLTLDGWGIATLGLLIAALFIGYRLIWRLAYFSESLVVSLTRAGLQRWARAVLRFLIGYDQYTYERSRYVVWNQVPVRFFILWSSGFGLTGIGLLFRLPPYAWWLAILGGIAYRLFCLWATPILPPIQTTEPTLKELIQQVNEPVREQPPIARPQIRPWSYLDELFARPI